MHVVIITPTFFPRRGGSEQTVFEWARRLRRRGCVSIVTLNDTAAPRQETLEGDIGVHRLWPAQIPIAGHVVRALEVFFLLVKINRRHPIDVIHMGHVYHLGLGAVLYKMISGTKLITTLLGWDTYDPIDPVRRRAYPYMAFVMNRSDCVVTMSRHMAGAAKSQGCRKDVRIIPHGSTMLGAKATIDIRAKHSLAGKARVCFSLQRLERRKGLEFLVEAVPLVLAKHPDAVFIVGGTGSQKAALVSRCAELGLGTSVLFAGFIADAELASYYEQSTLFVLPTLYEAFGIVYVDALAMGLPIVTTAIGGALDIVTGETGILVEPRSAEALAGGIDRALGRQWNRAAIREIAARKYSWDAVVEQYLALYEKARRQ